MTKRAHDKIAAGLKDAIAYAEQDDDSANGWMEAMQVSLDTVKRQLIETQQTMIKLVDAMKKQQEQINGLAKWAADNSDDVSPGGIIKPS